MRDIMQGVRFTVVTMLLCGVLYPLAVVSVGRFAFPARAEGSLLRNSSGGVVGSGLIAQPFVRPEYFHPRPSAVDYNAASTGGSNYGPSNPDHVAGVRERTAAVMAQEDIAAAQVPSEMVTTSGAGLDPHISPAAADLQAPRVATARGVSVAQVRELIRAHTEPPTFGVLGRARVNVLELNLALDEGVRQGKE